LDFANMFRSWYRVWRERERRGEEREKIDSR